MRNSSRLVPAARATWPRGDAPGTCTVSELGSAVQVYGTKPEALAIVAHDGDREILAT